MCSVERPRVSSYCLNAVIRLSLTIRFEQLAMGNFGRIIALGDGGCSPRATLPGVIFSDRERELGGVPALLLLLNLPKDG
jgi:hypothetical protein